MGEPPNLPLSRELKSPEEREDSFGQRLWWDVLLHACSQGPPLTDIVGASGRCAEPWGGGKGLVICISAGLQSTSSGEEVLLCWHPLEIKGG